MPLYNEPPFQVVKEKVNRFTGALKPLKSSCDILNIIIVTPTLKPLGKHQYGEPGDYTIDSIHLEFVNTLTRETTPKHTQHLSLIHI